MVCCPPRSGRRSRPRSLDIGYELVTGSVRRPCHACQHIAQATSRRFSLDWVNHRACWSPSIRSRLTGRLAQMRRLADGHVDRDWLAVPDVDAAAGRGRLAAYLSASFAGRVPAALLTAGQLPIDTGGRRESRSPRLPNLAVLMSAASTVLSGSYDFSGRAGSTESPMWTVIDPPRSSAGQGPLHGYGRAVVSSAQLARSHCPTCPGRRLACRGARSGLDGRWQNWWCRPAARAGTRQSI